MSTKKVIWSPKAVSGLLQLLDFIEHKWTKGTANNLLNEIQLAVEQIEQTPKIYPLFSSKKQMRKCVIKRKTLLFIERNQIR